MFVLEDPVREDQAEDSTEGTQDEPMVIAESTRKIRTLTPGMAALELGLADSGVVVFDVPRRHIYVSADLNERMIEARRSSFWLYCFQCVRKCEVYP